MVGPRRLTNAPARGLMTAESREFVVNEEAEKPSAEPAPASLPESISPYLVVGLGVSAGGLEAFKQLLEHLPENPGVTFLFAQHLEPHKPSLLREILGKATRLHVREAEQGMRLAPNQVYLIPPDALM